MAHLQVSVAHLGTVGGSPDASPMTPTKVLGNASPWGAGEPSSFAYPDCRAMGARGLHQVADSDTDAPNSSASRRSTPFSDRATSAALLSTAGSSGASADGSEGGGAEQGWAALLEGEPARIGGAPLLLPMPSPVGQQPMGLPLWASHGRTTCDTLGSFDTEEAESAPRAMTVPSPSHKGSAGGRAGNKGKAPDSPATEDNLKVVPQDRFHAQFRKTQLCRYIGTGCLRGEDCFYAHSKQELRVAPNLSKTSLCKQWQQGKCTRSAAECQFAHGPRDLRVSEGFQGRVWPGSENDQDPASDGPPPLPGPRQKQQQQQGGRSAKEKPATPNNKPAPAAAAARQGAARPAPGLAQQELLNLASFLPPPPPAPLQPEPVLPLAPGLGLLGPGFPSDVPDVSTLALLNAMAATIPLAAWSLARHDEASSIGMSESQTPYKDVSARDVHTAPSEAASTADQALGSLTKNRERFLSQFRKTQFCRYVKSGCLRGSQCPFAHSMEELSPSPDLAKTSLCKLWEQGRCTLEAPQCQFAHGTRDLRVTSAYSRGGVCKMFQQGKCNKGKDCPCPHTMPEPNAEKEKEGPKPAARQQKPKDKDAASAGSAPATLQMEPWKIPTSSLVRLGSWTGPTVDSNPVSVGNVASKAADENLSNFRLFA